MPIESQPFPSFICRTAGLPVNKCEQLRFNHTTKLFDEYYILGQDIRQQSKVVQDFIFDSVTQIEDKRIRAKLLSIRRDLFNNKLNHEALKSISKHVDNGLKASIDSLIEKVEQQECINNKFIKSYNSEIKTIRQDFVKLLQDSEFQKGLLLSSNSLFNTQKIYFKTSGSEKLNKKVEQLERGLLRYYTRMGMKATPFGTFCAILPGKFTNNLNGHTSFYKGNMTKKKSILLINKGLFTGLSRYLIKNEVIKKHINLELNPTIKMASNQLIFLTDINGKEVFQRLGNNPVLDLLREELIKLKKITHSNLINFIVKNEQFDTTEEEVTPYIEKLIEIGFLKYNFGIPAQEVEWNKILVPFLDQINDENAKKISGFLKTVQKNIDDFDKADIKLRHEILEKTTRLVDEITKEYSLESRLFTALPFYEDSTAECEIYFSEKQFNNIFKHLASFIQLTSKLASPRRETATMRKFFDDYYKDKPGEVPLLQFYEDYYKEHFKEHLEKMQGRGKQGNDKEEENKYNYSNPLNVDLIEKISTAWTKVYELITTKWKANKDNDEINFNYDELQCALSDVPECTDSKSFSIFGQAVLPADKEHFPRFIFPDGKYFIGYGKYFSRFLHLFPGDMQAQMYNSNNKISSDIVAEICGDDNFNANLHPPLVQYEISYPIGEGGLAQDQIDCTNITVEPDNQDPYSLRLKDKINGKFINPIDLGFLNLMMRPPLFQLLTNFSAPGNFSLNIPASPLMPVKDNKDVKKESSKENSQENTTPVPVIVFRPRIVYEHDIILTRKSWFIPDELFPAISDKEEDIDYFIRINKWRIENNIPREVYVRINILPYYPPPKDKQPVNGTEKQNSKDNGKSAEQELKGENLVPAENMEEKQEEKTNEQEVKNEAKVDANTDQKKMQKMSRDYYKPQYIDFNNPLLVNLFGKMTVNLKKFTVHIEENYPEKHGLMNINNEFYATEQIFQMNFPETNIELNEVTAEEYYEQ